MYSSDLFDPVGTPPPLPTLIACGFRMQVWGASCVCVEFKPEPRAAKTYTYTSQSFWFQNTLRVDLMNSDLELCTEI